MLLSSYKFECYFLLLSAQMFVTLLFCISSRFLFGNPFKIPALSAGLVFKALPMGILGVGNVGAGLIGLRMVNIPMFFCLRKLVTPFVLIYEYLAFNKVTDRGTVVSVLGISLGTVLAGWETLNDQVMGYLITMVNNVLSAATQVAAHRFKESTQCSTFSIVFMNAVVALPLTLTLAVVTGEVSKALAFPHLTTPGFLAGFAASSCMGLMLTYSSILSTTFNSPLATSVTGNVKDIFITAIGWVLFGGMEATALSMLGLLTTFIGAFAYSYISVSKQMLAQSTKSHNSSNKDAPELDNSLSVTGSVEGSAAIPIIDRVPATVILPEIELGAEPLGHRHL